jgi:hypothetical protein
VTPPSAGCGYRTWAEPEQLAAVAARVVDDRLRDDLAR